MRSARKEIFQGLVEEIERPAKEEDLETARVKVEVLKAHVRDTQYTLDFRMKREGTQRRLIVSSPELGADQDLTRYLASLVSGLDVATLANGGADRSSFNESDAGLWYYPPESDATNMYSRGVDFARSTKNTVNEAFPHLQVRFYDETTVSGKAQAFVADHKGKIALGALAAVGAYIVSRKD